MRWIIAQDTPGDPEHVQWSLIDTQTQGVFGHVLGQSFAAAFADGLNEADQEGAQEPQEGAQEPQEPGSQVSRQVVLEVLQNLVEVVQNSAERDCEHPDTGDGSPVLTCPVCMCWTQAQADVESIRTLALDVVRNLSSP